MSDIILDVSRRNFLKTTAAVSMVGTFAATSNVFAAGADKIKVGIIGCGGRGTGAMLDCFNADPAIELVAMGDLFEDKLKSSLGKIKKRLGDSASKRIKVTPDTMFTGFDNYKKVLACDVDLIVTAALA